MTAETVGAGIGLILISLGVLIIAIVQSARTERRHIAAVTRVNRAAIVTPKDATGLDNLWLELLATPAPRVPFQRQPGAES